MLQPRSSSLMPEWYREYLAFVSKGNMDPQQFSLLLFLSKFYNAKLYYTICSRIVPLSYLATFEDTVIVFKYTSYPSEGCIICVSTVRECITALFTVRKGQLIYDESFTLIVHDQILAVKEIVGKEMFWIMSHLVGAICTMLIIIMSIVVFYQVQLGYVTE